MSEKTISNICRSQMKSFLILTTVLLLPFSYISYAEETVTNNESDSSPVSSSQDASSTETPVAVEQTTDQSEKMARGRVARAIFTSQIVDREPTDEITELSTSSDRIYFFTDLRKLEGQIVTHHWKLNGESMADVKFRVGGGSRWRVYSSKNLLPEWTGSWTVEVTNESDEVINTSEFDYVKTEIKNDVMEKSDNIVEENQEKDTVK